MEDHLRALSDLTAALESVGLRYVIGGSLASSLAGESRASMDADVIVDLREASLPQFLAALDVTYLVDAAAACGIAALLTRAQEHAGLA